MITTIYYRGFNVIKKGCRYLIDGTVWSFFTLEEAKRHIDWMQLDKPNKTTTIHL